MTAISDGRLKELLQRVKAATGPDREIDEALMALTYVRDERHIGATEGWEDEPDSFAPVKDKVWVDPITNDWVSTSPHSFTGSVDAALSLMGRKLGVGDRSLCYAFDLNYHCTAHRDMAYLVVLHLAVGDPANMQSTQGQANTLPLAILSALLFSLTQEQK